jgi:hypothetical protein
VLAGVAIAASMLGTTLARRILEAMSDAQFRTWANRLITTGRGLLHPLRRLAVVHARKRAGVLSFDRFGCGGADDPRQPDALVLDLVEWIGREPRLYSEVIETWRTSCPRLTIWEDAGRSRLCRAPPVAGQGVHVAITPSGEKFLREHGPPRLNQSHSRARLGGGIDSHRAIGAKFMQSHANRIACRSRTGNAP